MLGNVIVETSSSTVEILTGAIALLVGIVGPLVLWKNTDRTLSEERARLRDTLAAEDRRLTQRFEFERGERDREEVRAILDRLVEEFLRLDIQLGNASAVLETRREAELDRRVFLGYRDRVYDALMGVGSQNEMAQLRLGKLGTRIGELVSKALDAAYASFALFNEVFEEGDLEAISVEAFSDHYDVVHKLRQEVMEVARAFTRAELYDHARPEPEDPAST